MFGRGKTLHARVTTVTVKPESVDEVIRIYKQGILPSMKRHKGFKHGYMLANLAKGEGMSVTLWTSDAEGKAYEASGAYQQQLDKLRHLMTSTPSLETFDVPGHG